METHAALPDRENLQRMRQVVSGFVKQAIPDAPPEHHTHHTQEQDVFGVAAGPGRGLAQGGKWLVAQPGIGQQHEQAEGREVGQPVPVDGQRPQLQSDRIDLRMDQHGLRLCTQAMPTRVRQSPSSERSRTAPLSADMASKA